ncbi:hypothetical protein T484DRAFT_1904818 [Baffinella frigidus]|nr:hypothetical protein T484DRAFT_1904818 [Cryptophyta sp. CCMP2293]
MGYDKRNNPGPGQYHPRRTAQGGQGCIGDAPGAHSVTTHGFSMGGSSKDFSVREAAVNGPWAAQAPDRDSSMHCFLEGGLRLHDSVESMGKQLESTKRTNPIVTFPQSTRPPIVEAYREHGIGPRGYDLTQFDSVGSGKVALKEQSPAFSMMGKLAAHKLFAHATPGPGAYNALDVPKTFPGPAVSMATSERPEVGRRGRAPAPGAYDSFNAVGLQQSSHRKTMPAFSWSKAELARQEEGVDPVFISSQHTAESRGRDSPGPQVYTPLMTSKGKGVVSRPPPGSGVAFATSKKMRPEDECRVEADNPGPGAYESEKSFGKQARSSRRNPHGTITSTVRREHWNKVYMSKLHTDVDYRGCDSPGPAYLSALVASNGDKIIGGSGRHNRIGTGHRIDLRLMEAATIPGPGAYDVMGMGDVVKRPETSVVDTQDRVEFNNGKVKGASFSTATRSPFFVQHDEFAPRGDMRINKEIDAMNCLGSDAPPATHYINSDVPYLYSTLGGLHPGLTAAPQTRIGTSKRYTSNGFLVAKAAEPGPGKYATGSVFFYTHHGWS